MIHKKVLTPFQKFVKIESFSGILLFCSTLIALAWANSPYAASYDALWQFKLGFSSEIFELKKPLILWINDGLMAIFFFVIGLEIKRELLLGELNSIRKATFPLVAAIGGMLIPMILFMLMNKNPETAHGWGVPMATDIAFALAIIKLLGKRVPLSLKIFLTAFAIVDDIGAVLVIAIFYSTDIHWILLAYAAIPLLILFFLAYRGVYVKYLMFFFGVIIWVLFLKSGIHPTVAGILVAFTVPIRQKIDIRTYTKELLGIVDKIEDCCPEKSPILTKEQIVHIDNLEDWTSKVQSPLQHLEHRMHNWVSYFIMPVFALSNAGVAFGGNLHLDTGLIMTLVVAMVAGNFIGVTALTLLSVKLKLAEIPTGISITQIIGTSFLAGVGFTMSIFIANLAFADTPAYIDSAKVGILIGSTISGIIGYTILRISSKEIQIEEDL